MSLTCTERWNPHDIVERLKVDEQRDRTQYDPSRAARYRPAQKAGHTLEQHVHAQVLTAPGDDRRPEKRDPDQDVDLDLVDPVQREAEQVAARRR